MALIAGAGFGGGRRPRTPQRWGSMDVWEAERVDARLGYPGGGSVTDRLGRAIYPTQLGVGRPQYAPGAAAAQYEHMQRIGMGKENAVINLGGGQPQYANWWEDPNRWRGPPSTPDTPGAAPITPTPWGPTAQPLWEGAGMGDWLNMRSQDWAAMPREVRSYLETWLRQLGWRPGGAYGRYGARRFQRAEGADPWTAGQYMGEQAFAGIPENLKPWLFWLSGQKGWRAGGREAERPATAGWGW